LNVNSKQLVDFVKAISQMVETDKLFLSALELTEIV